MQPDVNTIKRLFTIRAAQYWLTQLLGRSWLPMTASWPILAFIVLLLLFTIYMTFVPELPSDGGWTFEHWTNVVRPYVIKTVIPNTLLVGVGSVIVSMFFALPLSWLLNRAALPFRRVFITLIGVVIIVPGFVKAMAWVLLVNERSGLLNKYIAALLGLQHVRLSVENNLGMAWVLGLSLAPSVFFLVSGAMRSMAPDLEEAAAVAGAKWWRRFLWIDVPLVWPAILGAAIYNFMTAIAIFEVPAMLGGAGGKYAVLATELFYAVHPMSQFADIQFGAAGVYGTMVVIPSFVALYFYYRVLGQAHRYRVITGRGYSPKDVELGRFKYLALGFVLLYFLLATGLPMLVLIWTSLLPYLQLPSHEALSKLTLDNYRNFQNVIGGMSVFWNTVVLVVTVPLLVLFFSLMTSWVVIRTDSKMRRVMDVIAMFPHAIPGLAIAFALFMLALLLSPWLPLVGGLSIIVVAHTVSYLAAGTRITNSALVQVHRELEEAAYVCRARGVTTIWRIVLPLVKPSLVYAGLWIALLSGREVSMALFLTGTENKVFFSCGLELGAKWDFRPCSSGSGGARFDYGVTSVSHLSIHE